MPPRYLIENLYTHVPDLRTRLVGAFDYEIREPESEFERQVQQHLAQAHAYLHREEFGLALHAYRSLRGFILSLAHPSLPPATGPFVDGSKIDAVRLVAPMFAMTAKVLLKTPPPRSDIPPDLTGGPGVVPDGVAAQIAPFAEMGLFDAAGGRIADLVHKGEVAAAAGRWAEARGFYVEATNLVPRQAATARAAVAHDLAILHDKVGDLPAAIEAAKESGTLFRKAGMDEAALGAMTLAADLQRRAGLEADHKRTLRATEKFVGKRGFTPQVPVRRLEVRSPAGGLRVVGASRALIPGLGAMSDTPDRLAPGGNPVAEAPLRAGAFLAEATRSRRLTILGDRG
ncbi:MAG: hypothetical protein QN131_00345 [Armatimonadota bacterium]|nr:hypothetical protein [Armatimonadota bacterium]MDR7548374.1 hypothetical protein [Armatimonadota bacterium]